VTEPTPLTLGRAWDLLDRAVSSIIVDCPAVQRVDVAGGARRFESVVTSAVLVVKSSDPALSLQQAIDALEMTERVELDARRVAGLFRGTPIEIAAAASDDYGTALFNATGSADHVRAILARGLSSSPMATEERLYASVGLPFIPPELRQGNGEIEAAAAGRLPALVDVSDIRGDFHMHSRYSDGRDPIAAMVEACDAIGYEYIAITDHSWGSAAPRTLAVEEIARQADEIDALRDRFPRMAILHGVEVDILQDGRLDFEDSVLERFDIVLASLHDAAGHDAARLTARSLAAIRHPLVNVLCHPANRLPGRFSGYELDFDALFEAAVETGTALEIDGAPSHLDLESGRARAAATAGVTLTIDSDCHRFDLLARQMRFGVGTARRAWVERQQVLNCRPLADVRAFIAAKRR
jgi:DNA polymerase (family 10)